MLRALYTSATGMHAQELLIDNTANNIANVNTAGFKRSQMNFADLVYTTLRQPGAEVSAGQQVPTGLQIGSGVRAVGTTKLFSQGTLQQTGNPLDVAIEGQGFFQVTLPDSSLRYTRNGHFGIDAQGQLVTEDGLLVTSSAQLRDAVNITIGDDGTISGEIGGQRQELGTLQLFRFSNPAGLSSEGGNLYSETISSGQAEEVTPRQQGMGSLRQFFLEGSNVEVVTELISLISAQRAYEVNSRAIRAGDEMLSTTANIVR